MTIAGCVLDQGAGRFIEMIEGQGVGVRLEGVSGGREVPIVPGHIGDSQFIQLAGQAGGASRGPYMSVDDDVLVAAVRDGSGVSF